MHQAVHAAQVHEGTKVDHAGHDARTDLAGPQVVEELLTLFLLGLLQPRPTGQDHVVAVLVQLDDLCVDRGANEGLQVTDPPQVHQGGRQESPQADVHDEAALDHLDDGAGDDAIAFLDLLDPAPGPLVLGPLLGEDQTPVPVLALEDHGLDLLADGHDIAGVDAVADRQLTWRDHAFGLVTDVEEDLVLVDSYDGALHELPVLDVDHGGRVGLLQGQGAEVVLGDRARNVLAALVEGPHGRGFEGGCGQGEVGHVFFSSDGSRWTGSAREPTVARIGPQEPTGGRLVQRPEPFQTVRGLLRVALCPFGVPMSGSGAPPPQDQELRVLQVGWPIRVVPWPDRADSDHLQASPVTEEAKLTWGEAGRP